MVYSITARNKPQNTEQAKCHAIIHIASAAAGVVGGGLAQIPASDSIVITPIQLAMVLSLGKVFDLELSESAGMASLPSASGAAVGRGISQVLVGWIPGIGNIVNAGTAASLTEAIDGFWQMTLPRLAAPDEMFHDP
ncbi:hypothetical protein [Acutalibacter caecimuris]|uniref:hypothetical protein n=1 Tax=Acutalibacter caecimuris TaxID=3093657 RepID=UPI002AC9E618|nr:hypothetical protein [Acutalibacter sp. M00118]